ncbi:MAG: CPBP family intramembrane glutamic endopeptidase [Thermosynechococcaceae cyanobacterium]
MILVVYIAPILLMFAEVIPSDLKYHVLIGMSTVLLVYARLNRVSFVALGFTRKNLKPALLRVMPVSLLVAAVMLTLYFLGWFRSDSKPAHWSFYFFYIFVSATLQEFVYRGFLFHFLSKAGISIVWTIVITAGLYGFMHILFDVGSVVFTFLIGLFWGWAYAKDRNIYGVTLSHCVLGCLSLLANFS